MVDYTFVRTWGSDVEVVIDGSTVIFVQIGETEGEEYSKFYFMDGYVEGSDEVAYTAIGEYEKGSDNFVDLTDVERC